MAREFRFALAMNGGVSLAVWIGGVCDELLRLVRAGEALDSQGNPTDWDDPYQVLCYCTDLRPRVDVMTGASAGGMNGIFLSLGLIYKHPNLNGLRDLWIEQGSFTKLLRDPLDSAPPSLLRGDNYFLMRLDDAVGEMIADDHHPIADMPIDLQLTVTTVEGFPQTTFDRQFTPLPERRHNYTIHLIRRSERDDFVVGGSGTRVDLVRRLARACRTTASFPGAFEPSLVEVAPADGESTHAFNREQTDIPRSAYAIDGGVLVNLPVSEAIEAIFDQEATGPVTRVFALVVPDPSIDVTVPEETPPPPSLNSVVAGSLSGIPRNVQLNGFLAELADHSGRLTRVRSARATMLHQSTLQQITDLGRQLLGPYRRSRHVVSIEQLKVAVVKELVKARPGADRHTRDRWVAALDRLTPADLPWVPTGSGPDSAGEWGWSAVRRSCARVLHILDLVDGPQRARSAVHEVRGGLDQSNVSFRSMDWTLTTNGDVDGALQEAFAPARAQQTARAEAMTALAAALEQAGAGPIPWLAGASKDQLVELLLALEVIEGAFGSYERMLEQPVESLRIDSISTSPIDRARRSQASGKVAGVQLGHFGSFLQATWRANDWMWGRLDGAGDLIATLLSNSDGLPDDFVQRVATAEQHRTSTCEPRDPTASAEERIRKWLHVQQHVNIMCDEAETLRSAIRVDRAARALSTDTTRAVTRVLESKPAVGASESERRKFACDLLAANRFGEETIKGQLGGDLLTGLSAQAIATGATVLRTGGPKLLRTPIAMVRYVALVAWGLLHGAMGGEFGKMAAALAFGAGTGIVTLDYFTEVDLGVVGGIGLLLFAAGVIIGFARSPMLVVPLLLLAVLPQVVLWASEHGPFSFYPADWPWPSPDWADQGETAGSLTWLPPVAFVAAALAIGLIRRPGWMQISSGRRERSVELIERHADWAGRG